MSSKILPEYGFNYKKARADIPHILETIEYPYLHLYTPMSVCRERFKELCIFQPIVIHTKTPYVIPTLPKLSNVDLQYKGDYVLIQDSAYEYPNIEVISDFFNEEVRVRCRFLSAKGTPYESFRNNLPILLTHLQHEKLPITLETLREANWWVGNKECSTFKPKLQRYCIQLFRAKRILDISSGWGDRLIGAMASNIDVYHGFDPNPHLQYGYQKIIETFKDLQVNPTATFVVQPIPFERADLPNGYYDLVMSSPPYFNMELYDSDTKTNQQQSVLHTQLSKKHEREWYDTYLMVWMEKCIQALRIGGHIALNINQRPNQQYVYWLIDDLKKHKKVEFIGTISHGKIQDRKKKHKFQPQPIFIWKVVGH